MIRLLQIIGEFVCAHWRMNFVGICLFVAFLEGPAPLNAADGAERLEYKASFHIEPGSLESALIQFSRQSGIQIVVSAQVVNISVAAIEGRRNAREVLTTLLNATGLTFTIVGETVTVYPIGLRPRGMISRPLRDFPQEHR